jgi:hypothetical protein
VALTWGPDSSKHWGTCLRIHSIPMLQWNMPSPSSVWKKLTKHCLVVTRLLFIVSTGVKWQAGKRGSTWHESPSFSIPFQSSRQQLKQLTCCQQTQSCWHGNKLPGRLLPRESSSDYAIPIAVRYRWWLWSQQLTLAVVNAGESPPCLWPVTDVFQSKIHYGEVQLCFVDVR